MRKGQKISEATRQKMSKSAKKRILIMPHTNVSGWNKGKKTGITPANYKGENVSYSGLHHWVKYHLGSPKDKLCTQCNKQAEEWANVSGEYKRDLLDWQPMCVKCHRAKDDVIRKSWKTRKGIR